MTVLYISAQSNCALIPHVILVYGVYVCAIFSLRTSSNSVYCLPSCTKSIVLFIYYNVVSAGVVYLWREGFIGISVKGRVEELAGTKVGWGVHKIHYLDLLDEEKKSLTDALSSQILCSIWTGGNEQNQKYSSDVSSRSWMAENIFLKT